MDAGPACAVGLGMLALHSWLAGLYGFPTELVLFIGAANLTYAMYSGSLALRAARGAKLSRLAIDVLVAANSAWVLVCLLMLTRIWSSSGVLGLAHVALEALFVGGLAVVEWRVVRHELVAA